MTVSPWDVPVKKDRVACGKVYLDISSKPDKSGNPFFTYKFLIEEVGAEFDKTFTTRMYDKGFAKYVRPSLKEIFPQNPSEVHDSFMAYEWKNLKDFDNSAVQYAEDNDRDVETADDGRKYVPRITINFLQRFETEEEMNAYYQEISESEDESQAENPAAEEVPSVDSGMSKEDAEAMISTLVTLNSSTDATGAVKVNMETLKAQISTALSPHFTIESEEVKAAIQALTLPKDDIPF